VIVGDAVYGQFMTMFAGYENFSTYFVDADDITASDAEGEFAGFPSELKPCFSAADPWFAESACNADFVVVAEFSELEGPVPRVSTINVHRFCLLKYLNTSNKNVFTLNKQESNLV